MSKQMSSVEMQEMIIKLQADNEALKAKASAPRKLGLKVSAKGALSLYGMGKWPVTLYKTQWNQLLAYQSEIAEFIKANDSLLAVKE